jgi:hypothetical protein
MNVPFTKELIDMHYRNLPGCVNCVYIRWDSNKPGYPPYCKLAGAYVSLCGICNKHEYRLNMLKHKVGDTVRIQTYEWIDMQEKDGSGSIFVNNTAFVKNMFRYAGKTAEIIKADEKHVYYKLSVDNGEWDWQDWMFDPDYKSEDEPLSPEDAIRAMLDGETLYNKKGHAYRWDKKYAHFTKTTDHEFTEGAVYFFDGLCRRHGKHKRPMTRWEILAWAGSEESRGWLVRGKYIGNGDLWGSWELPWRYRYDTMECMLDKGVYEYQRARLLPDLSGIDESTIRGFEMDE